MLNTEGKTNLSRCLEQFDGLTWLTVTRRVLRQIYSNECGYIRAATERDEPSQNDSSTLPNPSV